MPYCSDFAFDKKTRRVYHRYGKGKAFVYLYGKPYYFTFRPHLSLDRPWLKVKDVAISINDTKSLPWKTVSNKACITVSGAAGKKPICIRLHFSEKFDLQNTGFKQQQIIFLDRGFPKRPSSASRKRAMESMEAEAKLAQEGEEQCIICLSNVSDAKFAPCGNSGVCCACAFKLINTTKTCPLCRKEISFFTRMSA